jgi:cytochrome c556
MRVCAGAALAIWTTAMVAAQMPQKITTAEQFDKVMKTVGPANAALGKALKSGAHADARTALATIRQNLVLAETFWVEKKQADAIKFSQAAIARVDALDKALGAAPVDPQAVAAAQKELGPACRTCHTDFRVQDANGNYMINPEKVK